ncbi:hypothetical protein KDH83_09485 [Achromobacter sp. Marseille-Q0513]|uniref:hypothetical protein n=1 Tax=Achromobacter sp. Marseille-Q0513 TaxID=2829161 RepID=UPI001B9EE3B8|nr:hypothetical protein [Achromobacter sp. Marseille-Q0513]MBR8653533.1 hypothetical protein [Achromobacter sp. Marseille-Q0513]
MENITISRALQDAHTVERVVELINAGTCEGVDVPGGHEFTPEMLAGQYAYFAAEEHAGDRDNIIGQLEFIASVGANFDENSAADYAMRLYKASNEQ